MVRPPSGRSVKSTRAGQNAPLVVELPFCLDKMAVHVVNSLGVLLRRHVRRGCVPVRMESECPCV